MLNTFRLLLIAGIMTMTTACATLDEPADEPESPPQDPGQQDSQRLLVPQAPSEGVPDADLAGSQASQNETTQNTVSSSDAGRLAIPLPDANTLPGESTGLATAPQNNIGSPATANEGSDITEAAKPATSETALHHRTNDINVVAWRAERGHVPSQLFLGRAYFRGDGVPRDLQQARLWLELAAIQGNENAQYELGLMYFIGAGVQKDYVNASAWWHDSAANGNDKAQQRLGYMYSEGLGVVRDYEQAKNWYLQAATLGNAEAQTLLGSLLHEGDRLTHDYPQALQWYRRAAEQGHPHAQYALAILHHDGLGTPQDFVKCAAWVDVALANQYTDELGARDLCRSQLNEQSNAAADALATLWKAQYLR